MNNFKKKRDNNNGVKMMKDKNKIPVPENNVLSDTLISACSFGECTGLIPSGDSLTEEEFEEYKSIYPFSDAKIR